MPLEIVTPLHWWSETNRAAAELHQEIGKLYAIAIGGSQPRTDQVAAARAIGRRLADCLGKAERMEAGAAAAADPKAEVGEFGKA